MLVQRREAASSAIIQYITVAPAVHVAASAPFIGAFATCCAPA
jgi:hypothetical protein